MIRSGSLLGGVTIADHPASTSPIVVNTAAHGLVTGNVLIACDYTQAAIFQATDASPSSPNIAHAAGGGTSGNCSAGFPLACPASGSEHKFDTNGFVAPLSVTAWYIGNNGQGGRSLFRILNNGTPQEIAVGIADMQLQYLTRTGTSPATSYVDASSIASWAPTASATVIAVRVVLDLESEEAVGTDANVLKRQLMYVVSRRGYREIL
jgi:type IV pilus assembly protein PilW